MERKEFLSAELESFFIYFIFCYNIYDWGSKTTFYLKDHFCRRLRIKEVKQNVDNPFWSSYPYPTAYLFSTPFHRYFYACKIIRPVLFIESSDLPSRGHLNFDTSVIFYLLLPLGSSPLITESILLWGSRNVDLSATYPHLINNWSSAFITL